MTNGQQVTGTRDEHYNLDSVLYHLEEGDVLQRYIQDAEQANDSELAGFFQQDQKEDRRRTERPRACSGSASADASPYRCKAPTSGLCVHRWASSTA